VQSGICSYRVVGVVAGVGNTDINNRFASIRHEMRDVARTLLGISGDSRLNDITNRMPREKSRKKVAKGVVTSVPDAVVTVSEVKASRSIGSIALGASTVSGVGVSSETEAIRDRSRKVEERASDRGKEWHAGRSLNEEPHTPEGERDGGGHCRPEESVETLTFDGGQTIPSAISTCCS